MTNTLQLPSDLQILNRLHEYHDPAVSDIRHPFALEELLCRRVGQGHAPIVHLWRHPRAFVMGLRDSRLPGAAEAIRWLEAQGYSTMVRNSGGAAVPLDLGVVNVTLILPKREGSMDYREDFERMYVLIREALKKVTARVTKGEVVGSFCPGDYDLSIGGRKFCGIAQRRQQHALAVQAFVIVEGKGAEKAALARAFYDRAAAGADAAQFPLVEAASMASLDECLGGPLTAERFTACVLELLHAHGISRAVADLSAEREVAAQAEALRRRYES